MRRKFLGPAAGAEKKTDLPEVPKSLGPAAGAGTLCHPGRILRETLEIVPRLPDMGSKRIVPRRRQKADRALTKRFASARAGYAGSESVLHASGARVARANKRF